MLLMVKIRYELSVVYQTYVWVDVDCHYCVYGKGNCIEAKFQREMDAVEAEGYGHRQGAYVCKVLPENQINV
jgi:hypothetical protein